MKSAILSLLLSLVFVSASNASNWRQYYELTNKAELEICKNQLRPALNYYKQAFALESVVNCDRHLSNGFHLAMETGDTAFARKQLVEIMSRGCKQNYLNKLQSFYQGADRKFIQKVISSTPNDTITFNPIWPEIERIFNREQELRSYLMARNNNSYGPTDTVDKVDIESANELRRLFGNRIPNQKELRNYKGDQYASGMYFNIITHYTGSVRQRHQVPPIFDSMLISGLADYSVAPGEFDALIGGWGKITEVGGVRIELSVSFPVVEYNKILFLPAIQLDKLEDVNAMRKAIGLCTIQELITKIDFTNMQMHDGKYVSRYGVAPDFAGIFDTDEEEQLKEWQKTEVFPKKKSE